MFRATPRLRALGGVQLPSNRPAPKAYRSPYAPKYEIGRHVAGINQTRLASWGVAGGMFLGVLGVGAIFFTTGIPKVRDDIMIKLPIVGEFFRKEIPPEDNPF